MITNPYKVLGVPEGASLDECTRAYKKLAKKYHPDLNPNDKAAEIKMAEINSWSNGLWFHELLYTLGIKYILRSFLIK